MSNDFQIGAAEIFPREAGSNSFVADYEIICYNAYWIIFVAGGGLLLQVFLDFTIIKSIRHDVTVRNKLIIFTGVEAVYHVWLAGETSLKSV